MGKRLDVRCKRPYMCYTRKKRWATDERESDPPIPNVLRFVRMLCEFATLLNLHFVHMRAQFRCMNRSSTTSNGKCHEVCTWFLQHYVYGCDCVWVHQTPNIMDTSADEPKFEAETWVWSWFCIHRFADGKMALVDVVCFANYTSKWYCQNISFRKGDVMPNMRLEPGLYLKILFL